jgi:hypothetical protein
VYTVAAMSQIGQKLAYLASMPAKTTRRQLLERLGLVPVVAVLGAAAVAPAFLRVYRGLRFTMVHERELPKQQREAELDWAAERMTETLGFICFTIITVHRVGDRIVLGIEEGPDYDPHEFVKRMLEVAKPVELRIESVKRGIIDVDFTRRRSPFA